MIRVYSYRITVGYVRSLSDPLYVATITGPYDDTIGHNVIGLTPAEATEKLLDLLASRGIEAGLEREVR